MSILFAVYKKRKEHFKLFESFLDERNFVTTAKYVEDYTLKNFLEFNAKNMSGVTHILIDIEAISDNPLSFVRTINAFERISDIKIGLFIENIMGYTDMFYELGKNGFFNVIVGSPSELFITLREAFFSLPCLEKTHYEKIENHIQQETDKDKNYLFLRNNTEISVFCIKHQSDFLSFLNACRLMSYFSFLKASCALFDKGGDENRFRLLSEAYSSFQYHQETNSYSYRNAEYYNDKKSIVPKNYLVVNHEYLPKSKVTELKKSSILIMCCQSDLLEIQEAIVFIQEQLFDYRKLFVIIENAPAVLREKISELFQIRKIHLKIQVFFTEPSPHYFDPSNKAIYKEILKSSMIEI